jgi:hypothetical protein
MGGWRIFAMSDADRAFWEAIYRAVCAIAAAIKKRYLKPDKEHADS